MATEQQAQRVYEMAGFDPEGARRLAGLRQVILDIRARIKREQMERDNHNRQAHPLQGATNA